MFEFLAGWAAFAVVSVFILFVLWLVLKVFASFGNKQISSAFFAVVLIGGPLVALGYAWYLLLAFLIDTGFDALKFLVVIMVGGLFTVLWVCLEFVILWIWASAFDK
jgi:hypothetical protein